MMRKASCVRVGIQRVCSTSYRNVYKEAHIDGNTAQQFADKAQVEARGGKGGNGCISHEVLSPGRKRPSGGSGGRGGNVYIVGDPEMFSFKFDTYHFNGENGRHGGSQGMTGRGGKDVFIRVPLGTVVSERVPDELLAASNMDDLYGEDELMQDGESSASEGECGVSGDAEESAIGEWVRAPEGTQQQHTADGLSLKEPFHIDDTSTVLLVARGGAAGVGNKVATRAKGGGKGGGGSQQKLQSMPKTYLPGQHGDHRSLMLELKIIADVGLVGFPNAGKSSLLRALSNAQPKVASYRFTTLHPSVGVVEYSDCARITVADIPGLIEGAHENRGLGHDFLRHIERTKLLLYVLDASASEKGRTPAQDLKALVQELSLYDDSLLEKPALVFANKYDLDVSAKHRKALDSVAEVLGLEVLPGSALDGKGVPLLARRLREVLHNKASVSARPGVNEHDGHLPSAAAEEAITNAGSAKSTVRGAEAGVEPSAEEVSTGRRRRMPVVRRRKTTTEE